jgi:phosphoglycolate phosphatase-like HAD superfamily hydrolase
MHTQTRAILFDLDGTLVDTMQVFADVAADVMACHLGLSIEFGRRRYLETSGIPFFKQLEIINPGDERNAAAAEEFERRKLEATAHVLPDEPTIDGLRALRALGIGLAVSSNNFQDQVDKFAGQCPVELDLAMGFGGGLAKGRSHFARACEHFRCGLESLLFVGDSLADAQLARESGVRFVARLGTFGAARFKKAAPEAGQVESIVELARRFAAAAA